MAESEVLRVTITWSPNHHQVSHVFVNGRSIEGLSLSSAEVLHRYMAGLRAQGWMMLRKELSWEACETYCFQRKPHTGRLKA